MKDELIVLLPAYNEEKELIKLTGRWQAVGKRLERNYHLKLKILLVNDGSCDKTKEIGTDLKNQYTNFSMISHVKNKGLGAALKTGFYHILHHFPNAEYICVMDCDNTHDPEFVLKMVDQMNKKHSDVVIASRYQSGSKIFGVSDVRKRMSDAARWVYTLLWGIPNVKDYTCGYRLYRTSILKTAFQIFGDSLIVESGFTCMAELLYKLSWLEAKCCEIPFTLHYEEKSEKSKMKVIKTAVHSLEMAMSLRKNCQTVKTGVKGR